MTDNFQMNWRMTFVFEDRRSEPLTISYPLSVEFKINRTIANGDNRATFKIYNLNKATRKLIHKDINWNNTEYDRILIGFECGHGSNLSLAYQGYVYECQSYKDGGSPDVITEITCCDIAVYKYTGKTYSSNTPVSEIIDDIADVAGLNRGVVGDFSKIMSIPYTTNGTILNELNVLTGGSAFVDNNNLNSLNLYECIDNGILRFNSSNILGTPKRNQFYIVFDTLLTPSVILTQMVEIVSSIQEDYNGIVKVMDIVHSGMISASVECKAKTTLTCWYGMGGNFVYVKDGGNVPVISGQKVGLENIYLDIKANGVKAKSLNTVALDGITWRELIPNANLTGSQRPSFDDITRTYNTADLLVKFIKTNIGSVKYSIHGAWRSVSNNIAVGGVEDSKHLSGQAIDFSFGSPSKNKEYFKIFQQRWKRGSVLLYDWGIHAQITSYKSDTK